MKKIVLLALLLFTISWASAQTEKSADKKVSETFEQKFNSGDFNGIFDYVFHRDEKYFTS